MVTLGPREASGSRRSGCRSCYLVSMPASAAKRDLPIVALVGLMAASLGGLLLLSPIPQDQSYHQFADQRAIFGIPNFWNVVSNIPFLAVGAAGLRRFHDDAATVVFFLGVFLTGIGSSYYHWDPNDSTLFWDRLPMTLSFAALLALVVEERVNASCGRRSQSACSACCYGAGPTICGSTFGCSSFLASQCYCCFCCTNLSIRAHIIGLLPGYSTPSPSCLNSPMGRFIRSETS